MLVLVEGGDLPPRKPPKGARMRELIRRQLVDREIKGAVVKATEGRTAIASDGLNDIRRDRQHPVRYLVKRIDDLRAINAPKEVVKQIPRIIDEYIEAIYEKEAA